MNIANVSPLQQAILRALINREIAKAEHDELAGIMLPSEFYRALLDLRKNIQAAQLPLGGETIGHGDSRQL